MLPINPARIPQLYREAMAHQAAGRPDAALTLYRQILDVRPSLAEAHFQVGRIAAAQGDAAKAEAAFRRALKLKPREAAIWQALAQLLSGGKLKKLQREAEAAGVSLGSPADEAAEILRLIAAGQAAEAEPRALALVSRAPHSFAPAYALGAARAAQGKWGGAVGPLEKAVERDPAHTRALALFGQALAETRQPLRGEAALREADAKGEAVALPLAKLLSDTCRFEAAQEVLAAAAAKSSDPAVHIELGNLLAILRRPKDAHRAYANAIRFGAGVHNLGALADKLAEAGEAAAATAVLAEALKAEPRNAGLLAMRGQIRQSAGDLDGARADLMAAIRLEKNAAQAYRAYVGGGKLTADDPVLPLLAARLADRSLTGPTRRILSFAMAKAQEDLGNHGAVFTHLNRANALMRDEFPYDFETDLRESRTIIQRYAAALAAPRTGTPPDDAPIFVSGLPRSGTTLVETILAAHSRVEAGGELPYMVAALARPLDRLAQQPGAIGDGFAEAGTLYLRAARRRTGADEWFTDKAISTFSRVGFAALALPNARFLMLRRDPRDVGLSIYRNMFPEGRQKFSTDLRDIGRYIRLYDAFLAFWAEALPDRVKIVDYEALTAEPETNIRALVAAAGLEWEEACLSPHKARRRVETLSFAQVRQPIYRASVAAWRRYENELAPLLEALETPVTL